MIVSLINAYVNKTHKKFTSRCKRTPPGHEMENAFYMGFALVLGFFMGRSPNVAKITKTISFITQVGTTATFNWGAQKLRRVSIKIKGMGHTGHVMTPPAIMKPMRPMKPFTTTYNVK